MENGLVQCNRICEPPPRRCVGFSSDNMASVRAASRLLSKRILSKTKAVSSNSGILNMFDADMCSVYEHLFVHCLPSAERKNVAPVSAFVTSGL